MHVYMKIEENMNVSILYVYKISKNIYI